MAEPTENNGKSIRLDKWLKLSRICKTRAIATRACEDGKVKLNNVKAKPARSIHIGDVLTLKTGDRYRTFTVLDIVHKNISNKDAKSLYEEHLPKISEESKELYELLQEWDKAGRRK